MVYEADRGCLSRARVANDWVLGFGLTRTPALGITALRFMAQVSGLGFNV